MSREGRFRVAIVDDERPARDRLRQLLKDRPEFEIVGEAANGKQALGLLQDERPDLVFLDVQMPQMSGLDVCHALGDEHLPRIIFVTAFDQYALQAFEVHAVDYLLKPFDRDRFERALAHALLQLRGATAHTPDPHLLAFLAELKTARTRPVRLAFKSEGRVIFVRTDEIHWLEAEGNYVKLHAASGAHLLRETLTSLEEQLVSERFMRISRSVIVSLDRIKEIQPLFYGDHVVILLDGTKLTLSRTHKDKLEKLLERPG
jgi:two-component system, LytTR family, response regulator